MKKNKKRTIAKVLLRYMEKEYTIEEDFGYGYPEESASFMFEEGNYSCDCNLSTFIQQQCDRAFPTLDCGEEIEIVDIEIIQKEGGSE